MGRSQESFNKRENEKKRLKKKQDKLQKKEERKSGTEKRGLDDMIAYVDEYGNISSTPPDPNKKKEVIKAEDILVGVAKQEPIDPQDLIRRGVVSFFNKSKGYGFIKDLDSQDSIFVHINGLEESVDEGDKVTFETEMGPKGLNAVKVKIAKKETPSNS
jgi:cold shock CspA family protein